MPSLGKLFRTVQSELYFLKEEKDAAYYYGRKLTRQPHEPEFRALRFVPDSLPGCYLDVGANHGQSVESIKLFQKKAIIHCYEANPLLAEKLQRRYAGRSDIRVMAYGLADQKQSRPLYVPVYKKFVYDGLASFDRDHASHWLSPETLYGFSLDHLQLKETFCTTERLDDLGMDPIFIKIVVQGFQYQVIRGGIETIRQFEPILMIQAFQGQPALIQLLEGLGYQQYLFDDHGFYKADSSGVLNTILMTPRRAAEVTRSRNR